VKTDRVTSGSPPAGLATRGGARALGEPSPVRDEARRQSPGRASLDSS
jgi:hypothetical protein